MAAGDREKAFTRVLTQLLSAGLVAERFGGPVKAVMVSGRSGEGLGALVQGVLAQADLMQLRAPTQGLAEAGVKREGSY